MRKLGPLVRREALQLLSFKTLLVGHVVQPVAWLALYSVGVAGLIGPFVYRGVSIRYLEFAVPGLLALQGFNQFGYTLSRVADEKRHGMFRAVLMSGISPMEYVTTKAIMSVVVVALQSAGITAMSCLLLGATPSQLGVRPETIFLQMMGVVFWSNLGASLGTALCSAEKSSVAVTLLGLPVIFTGSVFYDSGGSAAVVRILSRVNPLTHFSCAIRSSMLFGEVMPTAYFALTVLTVLSVALARLAVAATDLVTIEK